MTKDELTAQDLALYLGCEVMTDLGDIATLESVSTRTENAHINPVGMGRTPVPCSKVKPILRPLSDMTEEEKEYVVNEKLWHKVVPSEEFDSHHVWTHTPTSFLWLIRQGFDIFGWIEKGLAVDKTNKP